MDDYAECRTASPGVPASPRASSGEELQDELRHRDNPVTPAPRISDTPLLDEWLNYDAAQNTNLADKGDKLLTPSEAAAKATTVATKLTGLGLGITAVLAAAAWGFCAGLGWVVAGFGRD